MTETTIKRVAISTGGGDAPLADDHDAVRHLEGLLHDVGDDDDADALRRDALELELAKLRERS